MAEPVKRFTEEQIERASYPDLVDNNLVTSKIPLRKLDATHGRVYYQSRVEDDDKTYLYSSTTILDNVLAKGIGFNMWLGNANSYKDAMDYASERADVGTITHALCMYLIWQETVDCRDGFYMETGSKLPEQSFRIRPISDEVKVRLQGFIDFCKDYEPTSIATEISLYTLDTLEDGMLLYPFAGTADNIMKIKDKKTDKELVYLIDIKTGKEYRHPHELQLTSYKILWDHIHGNEHGKIDRLACLYLNARGKYKLVEYKFVPHEWFRVYELFEYMLKDKRGNMPKIKIKEDLPDIYSLKEKESNEDE